MRKVNPLPPAELLNRLFHYDPETGDVTWKWHWQKSTRAMVVGKRAGYFHPSGHYQIRVRNQMYWLHRIVWKMAYGADPIYIDHINGNGLDNRLENLRSVEHAENCKNQNLYKNNRSGKAGVHWRKQDNCWCAAIKDKGKVVHLGLFKDKQDAIACRLRAEKKLGFHKNHGKPQHEKR